MLNNLLTVGTQVLILFAMIAIGFALSKCKLVSEPGVGGMTNTLLWAVTPCLIIETFSRSFDRQLALSLGIFAVGAILGTALAALLSTLLFRRFGEDSAIMTFAGTFSNCGFMGLPLAQALFGAEGVMYASIFVVIFHLSQWTYGYAVLSGGKISLKRLIVNPGVIGLVLGLPLFFLSVTLPDMLSQIIGSVADINTPLAMIVIGCHLARADLLKALTDKRVYAVSGVRLLLAPALSILLTWLLPIPYLSSVACSVLCIELAAPCAATSVLIGTLCGHDAELPSRCVAISTLLSVLTLPIISAICGSVL